MAKNTYVVLTNQGSFYGLRFLNLLLYHGKTPHAIVVARKNIKRDLKTLKSVLRRIGWYSTVWSILHAVFIQWKQSKITTWRGRPFIRDYREFQSQVIEVDDFNGKTTAQILNALAPDYIILAHTGIIKKETLETANKGVVNAHPGKLPRYRGIDIPWWCLLENRPLDLGSTLHFVNSGVDTGDIIAFRSFQQKERPPYVWLEEFLYEDCLDLLMEFIIDIEKDLAIQSQKQEKSEGRQYYKMNRINWRKAYIHYKQWCLKG